MKIIIEIDKPDDKHINALRDQLMPFLNIAEQIHRDIDEGEVIMNTMMNKEGVKCKWRIYTHD